ncbi:hypothetical protein ACMHYO_04180 [Allopusillimonas ginsengisoli]|uniref:hypothetical protein n=1 Tax=Allopusillimonas ginsengisoli TaxID=453575 RepID=UPI0039C3F0FB
MKTTLYTLLQERLEDKEFIEIKISELEAIAGDDWLLEVNEQAMKLNVIVEPHPSERLAVLVSHLVN